MTAVPSRYPLTELPNDCVTVAPSILSADFSRLGRAISETEAAGAEVIHIDVMDGHFVPNLTIGPVVVKAVRQASSRPFDVHLMLTHPDRYVAAFADAGADHITFHVESEADIPRTLEQIRDLGCSTGLCLKPATPAASLAPYMGLLDLVLIMSVEPGFGGQAFMADMLPKIRDVKQMIGHSGRSIHLQVDGGIDCDTGRRVVGAGANMLVAGSSLYGAAEGLDRAVPALREACSDALIT